VARVELEPDLSGGTGARVVQQVRWQVEDPSAHAAPGVKVRFALVGSQVVRGRAVADVHVGDDPEVGQRLERAVDGGPVDTGRGGRDLGRDLLGARVAGEPAESLDDRQARGRVTR
jgi:hypothetical protein